MATTAMLTVPGAIAWLIEPWLFVLADRYPRKRFVVGGLLAMGAGAFAAAAARDAIWLGAAITIAWLGSGSGVTLAQATLVDTRPDARAQVLARWTLLGEIGDLLAPLLIGGLFAIDAGWRTAFAVVGALALALAATLAVQRFVDPRADADDEDQESEEEPSLVEAMRSALANRELLVWLVGGALCDLLDEIVVVFATLHLHQRLGLGVPEIALVVGAAVFGSVLGVLITERLLKRGVSPLRILLFAAVSCTASYAGWLYAPSLVGSALLFGFVGLTAAPFYPIVSAQAYAALPGRSGTVNAVAHLFTPVMLAAPLALAWIADRTSPRIALAILIVEPIGIAAIAVWALSRHAKKR